MDPARELAQFLDRELELRCGLVGRRDRLVVFAGSRGKPSAHAPQGERDRHEPLLGAVVQVALQPATLLVGRLDDPRPRATDLGLDGSHVGEVADDRGDLVRAARRDPCLELARARRQVQREVEGLEATACRGHRRRRCSARSPATANIASWSCRPDGATASWATSASSTAAAASGEIVAVAIEADHPVGDRVDDRPQPALALAVEADQQRDRDRGRREVAGRDQDRRDVLGDVGDAADEVDDQDRQEDEPGDEDRQQLPPRARGRDQPAPDDRRPSSSSRAPGRRTARSGLDRS